MKNLKILSFVFVLFGLGIMQSCSSDDPLLEVIAGLQADQTSIQQGDAISFSNQVDLNIASWEWTFEGGTPATSTIANPSVTYNDAGDFDVKLVVRSGNDADSITLNDYITVDNSLKSLSPSGGTSRVDISQAADLIDESNYSFTTWVKAGSASGNSLGMVNFGKSGLNLYLEARNDGSIRVIFRGKKATGSGSHTRSYNAGSIPTDEWVHFAFTWDGDTARTYINGALDLAYGTPPSGVSALIRTTNAIFTSNGGKMSETAFWDKTLTIEEIQASKNSCIDPTNTDLLAFWDFKNANESTTTLSDSKITETTSPLFSGTIINAAWSDEQPQRCE